MDQLWHCTTFPCNLHMYTIEVLFQDLSGQCISVHDVLLTPRKKIQF